MPIIAVQHGSWQPPDAISSSVLSPDFSPMFRRHRPIKIEIDPLAVNCDTSHVAVRMERIAENYRQLEQLFSEVESRMPTFDLPTESPLASVEPVTTEPFRPQKPR